MVAIFNLLVVGLVVVVVVGVVLGVVVVVVDVVVCGVVEVSKHVPGGAVSSFTQLLVFGSNTKSCGTHL